MKICTWNSRGDKFKDSHVFSLLTGNDIDVLCLQECGVIDRLMDPPKLYHTTKYGEGDYLAKNLYKIIYYVWKGGGRCNMAMLIKSGITIHNVFTSNAQILYDSDGNELSGMSSGNSLTRAMLSVDMTCNGNRLTINNVHLPSGNASFARKVGYRLFCNSHMRRDANIFTLGDFNTEPDTWTLDGSFRISAPTQATHTGSKTLDYMISNNNRQYTPTVDNDNYGSDHYPVFFDI